MLQFPKPVDLAQFQHQTNRIVGLANTLKHLPLSSKLQQRIFHTQLLKSSLFSARVEGNSLTLTQAKQLDLSNPKERNAQELSNINLVLSKLKSWPSQLWEHEILQIHSSLMSKLDHHAGKFRVESSAIFDQYGNVVYLTPSPLEMKQMLSALLDKLNQTNSLTTAQLINIAQCHYYFEKTHPFLDGNGRTGRVLIHWQLYQTGLVNDFILPVDQFFDDHKAEYYFYLEKNTRDVTALISFFINGLEWALQNTLDQATVVQETPVAGLLPRREELLNIIQDHPYCSSDQLARRFPTLSHRTILNDLNYLARKSLITKHGDTRGTRYSKLN